MFTQKLYKTGNSIAVTIPKEFLEELGLKEGQEVFVAHEQGVLTIDPGKKTQPELSITPDFLEWLDKFNKQYGSALKELAKR